MRFKGHRWRISFLNPSKIFQAFEWDLRGIDDVRFSAHFRYFDVLPTGWLCVCDLNTWPDEVSLFLAKVPPHLLSFTFAHLWFSKDGSPPNSVRRRHTTPAWGSKPPFALDIFASNLFGQCSQSSDALLLHDRCAHYSCLLGNRQPDAIWSRNP